MNIFHELDEKFDGKLRFYSVESRRTIMREGEAVFQEGIAYIDALFDLEIFDHLHEPNLIGVERILPNGDTIYILFETLAVRPKHYESASLTPDVPPVLKWEYLERIRESWVSGGENWMEIVAIHTGYILKVDNDILSFQKSSLSPLIGSKAHIMSNNVIKAMVCVDNGLKIGILKGFNLDLIIDIYNIYRYHTGVFGFTGSGKSNLVSLLIRKLLSRYPDIKVIIFDIAGEYTVHLLDLMRTIGGCVYSIEDIPKDRFVETQVIPETILDVVDEDEVREEINKAPFSYVSIEPTDIRVRDLRGILKEASARGVAAKDLALKALNMIKKCPDDLSLSSLTDNESYKEIYNNLVFLLKQLQSRLHEKSTAKRDIDYILSYLTTEHEESEYTLSIPDLAEMIVKDTNIQSISIFYTPDPIYARMAASNLITSIFSIKKRWGLGNKILMVFDEAQEFIPDRTRTEDYTLFSNLAVETVLRQGRKYFIGGIIATQRLAHLNTNALQQLHSYFVSTLPRTYDRNVVSDAFSISRSVVDKTTELDVGEWIFVSYKATKLKNVPVEIKAENNEDYIINYFKSK